MIQTGDVARSRGKISSCNAFYNEVGLAQSRLWPSGTLCLTIAANIADVGMLEFDACFPDSVVGFNAFAPIESNKYFMYMLMAYKAMLLDYSWRYENGRLTGKTHPNPDYLFNQLLYQGLTRVRSKLALVVCSAQVLEHIIPLIKND